MPDPYTVTLAEPVPAPFADNTALTIALSTDTICVTDPTCDPTVAVILWVPRGPRPVIHRAVVSDIHSVASQAVSPVLAAPVYESPSPSPDPYTVTLDEPVPAVLDRRVPLNDDPASDVTACVIDPARPPTVIAIKRLPR